MKRILTRATVAGAAAVLSALGLAACSTTSSGSSATSTESGGLTKVKLQLQWVTQAQFAGYFAAQAQGYYKDAGLDVDIMEAGTETVLAQGNADYAIAWVPKALASREQGAAITDVAQVFQRSGTLQISMKDKGITSAAGLKGKKVGNWGFGNEFELFAGMTKAGLNPGSDVTLVQQPFDMTPFLNGDIDAAQAMTYNEYAQVLEATNPKTGKLYTPADLNVINWQDDGVGMLQDAIWASTTRLKSDPKYQDETTKFIEASLKGWAYCRDNAQACASLVVSKGSKLGASHQLWQMNEVNKLIWPASSGAGLINQDAWDQTVKIAEGTKNQEGKTVLTKAPDADAYSNVYVQKALNDLKAQDVDTIGANFSPLTVTLKAGGA